MDLSSPDQDKGKKIKSAKASLGKKSKSFIIIFKEIIQNDS